jgi:hypothetical protein
MSKSQSLVASQCITTVGVAEQITTAASLEEPLRKTAKRSVYSLAEQEALVRQSSTPVKKIDFLLAAHWDPFVPLRKLLEKAYSTMSRDP